MPAPAASQTEKYPAAITGKETGARRVFRNVGDAEGSIIATIMARSTAGVCACKVRARLPASAQWDQPHTRGVG